MIDLSVIRVVLLYGQRGDVTPRNLYRYKLGKIIMTGICIGISYGK